MSSEDIVGSSERIIGLFESLIWSSKYLIGLYESLLWLFESMVGPFECLIAHWVMMGASQGTLAATSGHFRT